ncbi:hypothetical protein HYALB_00002581, partial [Hymenoscyphus albidus]
ITVTDAVLDNFKLFANYTAASYCPNNQNSSADTLITCISTACTLVEENKAVSLVEFGADNTAANIKGFVALDHAKSLVVVAFSGSGASIRNWLTDFNIIQTPFKIANCNDCYTHSGFGSGWAQRRTIVINAVKSALAANPTYSLIITGHSIGGGVASLAGAELRTLGYPADIYIYGSPRAGNAAFAKFVTAQEPSLGSNYRVTHINDPVPQIIPDWIGYEHVSPEYWLSTGNATTQTYTPSDIVVCEGVGNDGCNTATGIIPLNTEAHNHYLGSVAACQGGLEL